MNRISLVQIRLLKVTTALDTEVTSDRLENIARILCENLSDEEIELACQQVESCELRLPPPTVFIKYAQGSKEDRAQVEMKLIRKSIRFFGQYRATEARDHIGERLWGLVERFGGWIRLCSTDEPQGVLDAQLLKGLVSLNDDWNRNESILEITNHGQPFGNILGGIVDRKRIV